MGDSSDHSSLSEELELASILGFLIRCGQVNIISSDPDDSDGGINEDEYRSALRKTNVQPDLTKMKASEISLTTKQYSGLIHTQPKKRPTNLVQMLNVRQNGMFGNGMFSNGDRCKVSNTHLPNRMRAVDVYNERVFCGTYSNDGEKFMTACQDRFIRLYETKGSEYKQTSKILARDVGWSILDTAFSNDGKYFVYSSWSENLHVCDTEEDNVQEALPLYPEDRRFCVFSVVFSSDGHEILGGANDGNLYIYNRVRDERTSRILGHSDDVNTVAFADSTSQIIYSGGDDAFCKVWDRRTLSEANPQPVGVLAGHKDGITFIDSKGDGRHLISNSKDQSIKLWDIRRFSSSDAQENTRRYISFNNWDYRFTKKLPCSVHDSKDVIDGDTSVMTYRGHRVLQTLIRCRFSPMFTTGQRYIYTGCSSGRIFIYDLLSGEIVKTFRAHNGCVRDVAWHPYMSDIVSSSWDYSVMWWSHSGAIERVQSHVDTSDSDDPDVKRRKGVRRSARLAAQRRKKRSERHASLNAQLSMSM